MSLPPEFQTFTGPKDANFIDNNNNKAAFNLVKFSARMDRTYDTAPTKGSISTHPTKNQQKNLEPTTKDNNLSYPMNVGESDQQQQGHYIMFSILESGHGKISKAANKKIAGLEFTEDQNKDIRYLKANVISVGNLVEGVKQGDIVHYDKHAGHGIQWKDDMYQVIRVGDVVIVDSKK